MPCATASRASSARPSQACAVVQVVVVPVPLAPHRPRGGTCTSGRRQRAAYARCFGSTSGQRSARRRPSSTDVSGSASRSRAARSRSSRSTCASAVPCWFRDRR
ncbi:Uncharacterised protein [Mycobacteroides abscessus]|nr:Uncharacterised protein [Mycobacteroides abscessus]